MGLSYLQTTEPSHCSTVPVAMATRDGGGNRIADLTGGGELANGGGFVDRESSHGGF